MNCRAKTCPRRPAFVFCLLLFVLGYPEGPLARTPPWFMISAAGWLLCAAFTSYHSKNNPTLVSSS